MTKAYQSRTFKKFVDVGLRSFYSMSIQTTIVQIIIMGNSVYNIAFNLSAHPIKEVALSTRMDYMKILGNFVISYSTPQATLMYQIFSVSLLGEEIKAYKLSSKELKKYINKVSRWHIKCFKLYSFRYILVTDILYLSAFDDISKAKEIITSLKPLYSSISCKRIEQIYSFLYKSQSMPQLALTKELLHTYKINIEHALLPKQTVAVVANMSTGKSTLINSLIGYPIVKTQNEACTSSIRHIENKPYDDGLVTIGNDIICRISNRNEYTATENQANNHIGIYYKATTINKQLIIVDTPGINYSQNTGHAKSTKEYLLKREWDILLVVLNATNIGTNDDKALLEFIHQNFKSDRIIFVINKLDCFCPAEDSIMDTMNKCRDDLRKIGFKDPELIPVSAYAALLAKKKMTGHSLNEEEEETFGLYQRKFKKEYYNFPSYIKREKTFQKKIGDDYTILEKSNILFIEELIAN